MRKAILSVVVAFALAGVVSAFPMGPGGTIYFGGPGRTGTDLHGTHLYYLDIDANWAPLDSDGGACVHFATVPHAYSSGGTNDGYGSPEIWYHPTSDKRDMNGSYHSATLLIGAYYDDNANAELLTFDAPYTGPDLAVILSDGVPDLRWQVPVDSNYTPNGEDRGIATSYGAQGIWTDTNGDGYFDDFTARRVGQEADGEYSALVGGGGVVVSTGWHRDAGYNRSMEAVDNLGNSVVMGPADCTSGRPLGIMGVLAAGDTSGNGVVDVYYDNSWAYITHARDLNSDGDWYDDNEALSIISDGSDELELIQHEGLWFLLSWRQNSNNPTERLRIFALDANGDFVPGGEGVGYKTILVYQSGAEGYGDSSLDMLYGTRMEFAPLGEAVPEPATMLLVGTGLLSLVGVIRRRRLN